MLPLALLDLSSLDSTHTRPSFTGSSLTRNIVDTLSYPKNVTRFSACILPERARSVIVSSVPSHRVVRSSVSPLLSATEPRLPVAVTTAFFSESVKYTGTAFRDTLAGRKSVVVPSSSIGSMRVCAEAASPIV